MIPGLGAAGSLFGGGGGLSASSTATATQGDTKGGSVGISVGGIQTGGTQGGIPQWVLIAGVVVAVLMVLRRR